MKTLRTAFIIIGCFIIAVGMRCSCCKCDEIKTKSYYLFESMQLRHIDNSGQDTVLAVNNSIKKAAYAINVNLEALRTGELTHRAPCYSFSLFINEAYAFQPGCSCPQSEWLPASKIKAIKITDLEGFDDLPPATDISAKFQFLSGFGTELTDKYYIPANEYFTQHFPYPRASFVNPTDEKLSWSVLLFLMEPPAKAETHRFSIILVFEDNRQITQTATPVFLE